MRLLQERVAVQAGKDAGSCLQELPAELRLRCECSNRPRWTQVTQVVSAILDNKMTTEQVAHFGCLPVLCWQPLLDIAALAARLLLWCAGSSLARHANIQHNRLLSATTTVVDSNKSSE